VEPVSVASNLFNAVLHGAISGSNYLIISTGELNPPTNSLWLVEGSLQGGTNYATPFALGVATRTNNLFIRAQACDECATTALPLWWQLAYFGVTGVDTNADYDNDGVNNLAEYLSGTDPNKIRFSVIFNNLRVSGNTATATFTVLQGVPAKFAVLRDSTNFSLATWTSYTPAVAVNLGSTEGRHDVWIGLKGRADTSVATWEGFRLTRDTNPPLVFITSPLATNLSQPLLQLQGYSPEPLVSLRYDVANDAGTITNLEGFVTRQWFDTNLLELTTNWFECLDIPLTNGANTITLYATDRACNVSTSVHSYTLDYSGVSSGPAVTLYWPQSGALVSGTSFTLRGLLDDPTATVTAQIIDANGAASQVDGLVERSGLLWVENLPLGPGTNTLTLMMTNAAGLPSSTSLTVIQSDVVLTIGDPSGVDLNQPPIGVMGTISTNGYTVWVNGVAATNVWDNGNGTYGWQVDGVPVNDGGTAVIQARAIPNTDHDGHGTGGSGGSISTMANPGNPFSPQQITDDIEKDRDPEVITITYWKDWDFVKTRLDAPGDSHQTEHIRWEPGKSGYWSWDACTHKPSLFYGWRDKQWDTNGVGTQDGWEADFVPCGTKTNGWPRSYTAPTDWSGEFCDRKAEGTYNLLFATWDLTVTRFALTLYELRTGGKQHSTRKSLFAATTTAQGIRNAFWPEVFSEFSGAYPIPPTDILLGSFGWLGNDALAYKVLADGTTRDVTPDVINPYYIYTKPVITKHRLLVKANTTPLDPDKLPATELFLVGQQMTFAPDWANDRPFGGAPPNIQGTTNKWTLDGTYVNQFTQSCDTCSVDRTKNDNLLTNEVTDAWWVSGAPGRPGARYHATLDYGLTFSNGQHIVLSEKGLFPMFRPLPDFHAEIRDQVRVDANNYYFTDSRQPHAPSTYLHFGISSSPANDGIAFVYTGAPLKDDSTTYGWYRITQVVESYSERYNIYTNNVCDAGYQTNATHGLDGGDPSIGSESLADHSPDNWADSPGVPLTEAHWLSEAQSFSAFLMFDPQTTGSIGVPMYKVQWSWFGSATNGPPWGKKSGLPTCDQPSPPPTEEFPSWTRIMNVDTSPTNMLRTTCLDEN
jgi:hypothetical protein